MYFLYIIKCRDGSLYTGITTDLDRRLDQHRKGTASHYTRARKIKGLVYSEKHPDRSSASKREAEIKGWTRERKLELIDSETH